MGNPVFDKEGWLFTRAALQQFGQVRPIMLYYYGIDPLLWIHKSPIHNYRISRGI